MESLIPTPIQLMKVPRSTPFRTAPHDTTLYLRTDEAEGQIIFRPTTTDRPLRSLPRHATVYILPALLDPFDQDRDDRATGDA